MSDKTLFSKIINREIPADFVYEDELCACFKDIDPQAPIHLLLIPKKPIPRIAEATNEDTQLLGHMLGKVSEIARNCGIEENGFRLVINNGANGGEAVPHLHIHILGGRTLTWPPG